MKKMFAASFVAVTGFAFADPTGAGGKTAADSDAEQIVYGDDHAVTDAIEGSANQHFGGFIFGASIGCQHQGHDSSMSRARATRDLPVGSMVFLQDIHGCANGAAFGFAGGGAAGSPTPAADLAAQTLSGGSLRLAAGGAPGVADFTANNPAAAATAAGTVGRYIIGNAAYAVDYEQREIKIEQKKSRVSGGLMLEYGQTFGRLLYLGLAVAYDVAPDNKSEQNGSRIINKGGIPSTALLVGVAKNGFLGYAKFGFAQMDASVNGRGFNHTGILAGVGLRKLFCNGAIIGLEGNWIKGKSEERRVETSQHLAAGRGHVAMPAVVPGQVGFLAASDITFPRTEKFTKQDCWLVKLYVAYQVPTRCH